MLTHVDLFSGIGGFALGFRWAGGFDTKLFCDNDFFATQVLNKNFPSIPVIDDVKQIEEIRNTAGPNVGVVTAGFPCQPWSVAGKREGVEDSKNRDLWPQTLAVVEALSPRFFLGENVSGFVNAEMGLSRTVTDLAGIGYQAVTFILPAAAVGLPHRRDRCWILAHANSHSKSKLTKYDKTGQPISNVGYSEYARSLATAKRRGTAETSHDNSQGTEASSKSEGTSRSENGGLMADTMRKESQRRLRDTTVSNEGGERSDAGTGCEQESRSRHIISRLDRALYYGIPERMDESEFRLPRTAVGQKDRAKRLKAIGNSVVPQIPQIFGEIIMEMANA